MKICQEALSEFKIQLDHRSPQRKSGDELTVVTPIIERLLETLNFGHLDRIPSFKVNSKPVRKTDIACQYPDAAGNRFVTRQKDPFLLVEIKATKSQLSPEHKDYWDTLNQLKEQLLGDQAKSAKFGIISNGWVLQLFRRHHKIIHPVSPILDLTSDEAEELANRLSQIINAPKRGTIIGIYNNKGGVGKTTITTNLGIVLAQKNQKVLLVDFDPNQADLTDVLGFEKVNTPVWAFLEGNHPLNQVTQHYSYGQGKNKVELDVIPADSKFSSENDSTVTQEIRFECLREQLVEAGENYDYILVDMPPNWRWLSKAGVLASDVLLVPANHADRASLKNLADLVIDFLPEVDKWRTQELNDSPLGLLPLVLNGYEHTQAKARNCEQYLDKIITDYPTHKEILHRFFYPRKTKGGLGGWGGKVRPWLELPNLSEISRSLMESPKFVPASLKYNKAKDAYENLIREVIRDV